MGKYKVKVNDIDSFQELCQSIYDETVGIINQVEHQINMLKNSADLKEEMMDGKSKYANAIHNFIQDKDRAIGRRVDMAKLLADLIKNQGNVVKTMNNAENDREIVSLSLSEFKKQLQEQEEAHNATPLY